MNYLAISISQSSRKYAPLTLPVKQHSTKCDGLERISSNEASNAKTPDHPGKNTILRICQHGQTYIQSIPSKSGLLKVTDVIKASLNNSSSTISGIHTSNCKINIETGPVNTLSCKPYKLFPSWNNLALVV